MSQARWRGGGREVCCPSPIFANFLYWNFNRSLNWKFVQSARCVKFSDSRCSLRTRCYSSNHQFLSNQWSISKFNPAVSVFEEASGRLASLPFFFFSFFLFFFHFFRKAKIRETFKRSSHGRPHLSVRTFPHAIPANSWNLRLYPHSTLPYRATASNMKQNKRYTTPIFRHIMIVQNWANFILNKKYVSNLYVLITIIKSYYVYCLI